LDKIDPDAAIITMQAMNATVRKVGFALAFLPRQWFCCERSIDVWMQHQRAALCLPWWACSVALADWR